MKVILRAMGVALWLVATMAWSQSAEDQYVRVYSLIQEADALNASGEPRRAMAKYAEAQAALARFPTAYPGWNDKLVSFRLNYVAAKLAPLMARFAPTNAIPAAPEPPAPKVPSGDTNALLQQLQEELRRLQSDNATLTAKLKEALSVQPPAADPRELTRAAEKNKALEKENELLKVALAQEQEKAASRVERRQLDDAQRALAESKATLDRQAQTLAALTAENDVLKKKAADRDAKRDETVQQLTQQLRQAREDLTSAQALLDRLRSENAALEKRMADLSKRAGRRDDLERELDSARAAATAAEKRVAQLEKDNAALQKDKAELERRLVAASAPPASVTPAESTRIKELQDELARQTAAAREREKLLAQLQKDRVELEARLAAVSALVPQGAAPDTNTVKELERLAAAARQNGQLVARLQNENATLQKQKADLEARLAGASAPPASPVPESKKVKQLKEELARLEDAAKAAAKQSEAQVRALEKEKARLAKENAELEARLTAAASEAAKAELKKRQQLEAELADLRAKLEKTEKQLARRGPAATAAQEELRELEALKARLAVLEAQPLPYTAEELAALRKPEIQLAVSATAQPAAPAAAPAATTPANPGAKPVKKTSKDLPPGAGTLAAAAQRAFAARRFDEAEQKYLEVLRQDEKNVFSLGNVAAIQIEMNKLDQAEKHLTTALALDPQDDFCLYLMGRVKFQRGKLDEALTLLSQAAKANPESAETQNYLGIVLSEKGLRAQAEAAFRKAIQLQPGYAAAHNNLAFVYATQKPPSLALARWHYQKALASGHPKNPELEKLLGEAR